MNKKVFYFAALVAAGSTALVSCSSDDDVLAQEPVAPVVETVVPEITTGIPMAFSAQTDKTSGTDYIATNLPEFKLYSNMTISGKNWATGITLTPNSSGGCAVESGVVTNWPDANKHTFYAVTDPANVTDVPSVTANDVAFTYTIPTTYANQKDLLVAKAAGSSSTGTPEGSVSLTFQHALAQITAIKVYCNADIMKPADAAFWNFRVGGIKLVGLVKKGTYTFDAATPWAASTDNDDIDADGVEIPLDDTHMTFAETIFTPVAKTSKSTNSDTLPLTDGGFYLIPQAATGETAKSTSGGYDVNGAYALLKLQAYDNTFGYICWNPETENSVVLSHINWEEDDSNAIGFQNVKVPLKFSLLQAGKGYTLVLDISKAVGAAPGTTYCGEGDLVLGESLNIEIQ